MADRTVKVRLELDDDAFKGGLKGDAAAVRDFDGEVRTLGDHAARTGVEMKAAGNDIQATGEEIKAVGRAAVPTTDQVRKLGDEATSTGDKVVSAGSRLETLTAALHNVDEEIARSKTLLGELAQEFGRTGDSSIVSKFSGTNSALSGLVKFRTELEKLKAEAERAPSGIGANAQGGLLNFALDEWVSKVAQATKRGIADGANAISGMPAPQGFVQWLVAGAVLAAPVIGAAINAGVLLGVGGAGIAAGLAGAAEDPRVKAAYTDLGQFAKQQLTDAAQGFIVPAIVSAGKLRATLGDLGPSLKKDLDAVAPSLANLVDGVDGLVKNLQSHGLGAAFEAARPELDALAQELPGIGSAMGVFFQHIADGGPGAVQFTHDFAAGFDATLENLGLLIQGTSKLYDLIRNNPIGQTLSPISEFFNIFSRGSEKSKRQFTDLKAEADQTAAALNRVSEAGQKAGLGAQLSSDDFKKLSAQISQTAATSDVLAGKITDRLVGGMLSLDQASLGMNQALLQVHDSFVQNGRQLDIMTAKGEANRSAVLAAVSANLRQYDALVQSGVGAEDAAKAYDQNTAALEGQLRKAGLTQAAIDGLIGKYRAVPNKVDTVIAVEGLTAAINNLNTTLQLINDLHDKTVTVTTYFRTNGTPAAGAPGGNKGIVSAFAQGGIVEHAADGLLREAQTFSAASTGARYAFAEPQTGGEAFIPKSGDLARSRSIWSYVGANWLGMKGAAGHGSVTSINVTVNAGIGTDGYAVGRQLADAIKPYIRSAGGGNVQAALGVRGS